MYDPGSVPIGHSLDLKNVDHRIARTENLRESSFCTMVSKLPDAGREAFHQIFTVNVSNGRVIGIGNL